jgi:MurNAc alpha-1-phosphate uridylyltransferase
VLDRLGEAGIKRAVVNLHHKADLIERHVSTRKVPAITFSHERETLLDTGGGVKKVLPLLGPGPFLIQNADSVWIEGIGSNLGRLMDAWDDARMDCLMMLALSTAGLGY